MFSFVSLFWGFSKQVNSFILVQCFSCIFLCLSISFWFGD